MRLLPLLLLVPALLLAACGGGGGGDQIPAQQVVIQLEDFGLGVNGAFIDHSTPQAGDLFTNVAVQGLLRFPLVAIPAGAQIVSVEFQAAEGNFGNPFTVFAGFRTEVVDAGGSLEDGDLTAAPVSGSFPVDFSSAPAPGANRTLDVTAMLKAALAAGLTSFDFRVSAIGAPTNNDNADDAISWKVVGTSLVVTFVP